MSSRKNLCTEKREFTMEGKPFRQNPKGITKGYAGEKMKVKKAVLPAAGLGTRFLPLTKAQPKEMLPMLDKPMIQYVVEEAVAAGLEDIIIVTGRGKRAIEDHFDKSFELEHYAKSKALREREKRLIDELDSLT